MSSERHLFPVKISTISRSRGILGSLADTFAGLYDTYVADYVTNQYRDFVEGYTDATLKVAPGCFLYF